MIKIKRKGQSIFRRFYDNPNKREAFIRTRLSRMSPAQIQNLIYGSASKEDRVRMEKEDKIVKKFIDDKDRKKR